MSFEVIIYCNLDLLGYSRSNARWATVVAEVREHNRNKLLFLQTFPFIFARQFAPFFRQQTQQFFAFH